jgi:hypothetical protein
LAARRRQRRNRHVRLLSHCPVEHATVHPDRHPDHQGEVEGVAGPGVDLGRTLRAVDHHGGVERLLVEPVDADLDQAAAERPDQGGGQVRASKKTASVGVVE